MKGQSTKKRTSPQSAKGVPSLPSRGRKGPWAKKFGYKGGEVAGKVAFLSDDYFALTEIDPDLAAAYRKRDRVLDQSVDDCIEIEDLEMADHLAAMRVALFAADRKAA